MTLAEYIGAIDESQAAFARRAGVDQKTINMLCRGMLTVRSDTALKIIVASQAIPAPNGEFVTLEEIVDSESVA